MEMKWKTVVEMESRSNGDDVSDLGMAAKVENWSPSVLEILLLRYGWRCKMVMEEDGGVVVWRWK